LKARHSLFVEKSGVSVYQGDAFGRGKRPMKLRFIGVAAIMAALCSTTINAQSLKNREHLEEASPEARPEAFLESIGGPRFVVAQFFTILGTIFGVYLASYVAFQRSLKYDRFVKAQQRSDLLMAMRDELRQNVVRLRKFNERLPGDSGTGVLNNEWPHLRSFVWQAAGRSPSALDVPQIMMAAQSLYEDVADMLNDTNARQLFRQLTSSTTYDRMQFKERLNDQLALVETSVFPAIDEALAASAQLLKKYADQKASKA
jgi:hypothetical protein